MKAVAIVSGGMDSVTALHHINPSFSDVIVLSFNYGQRHLRELEAARYNAIRLGREHHVIDLPIADLLPGSALTDPANVPMPHGHYAEETMRQTVVPGRNAMMLSIAWGVAAAHGCDVVVAAVHAGDHFIYPDCRPEFVRALEDALRLGTIGHGGDKLSFFMPFQFFNKADILRIGHAIGVDYAHTWTCYEGGDLACGRCGACRERLEAFDRHGKRDPLRYAP